MSFFDKIKRWFEKKTYLSFRDAENFEEKDCRLFSNADACNISIVFFIISFAFGIFCSTIYFRCYIDPSYQEEKNKLMIRKLYEDLDRIKKNNTQRNNFLISLQNFMNDKDDFSAESCIKNYNAKYFCFPIADTKAISSFEEKGLVFRSKVKKEDKILAIDDGLIVFVGTRKNNSCVIFQNENGFVSVYNFVGKILKNADEMVKMGENIALIDKNSEMTLQVFHSAQKISLENLFIN